MADAIVYRFPDNATPNRVAVEGRNVYYSNKAEKTHGHSVRAPDGTIKYARTRGGRRLK